MIDRAVVGGSLPVAIAAAVAGGVDWIQVRERELDGRALLELTDAVTRAARSAGPARIVINRRSDVALAAEADGVHLGYDAVAPAVARALLGDDALLGRSVHAPDEIDATQGLSYVHLAPVFPPLSKPPERDALGVAAVTAAARRGVPVLAQGGVDATNARSLCDAGAAGIAVTGAILMRDDPEAAARALREAIDG